MDKDAEARSLASKDLATPEGVASAARLAARAAYKKYYALHGAEVNERVKAAKRLMRTAGHRVLDHCVATGERDLQAAAAAVDLAGLLEEAGSTANPERALRWVAARLKTLDNRRATEAARQAELDDIERLAGEVAQARARWEAAKAKEREEAEALRQKISQELAARRVISQRAIHKEIHRRKARQRAVGPATEGRAGERSSPRACAVRH